MSQDLASDASGNIWVLSNGRLSIYSDDHGPADKFPQHYTHHILPSKCRYLIDGGLFAGFDDLACESFAATSASWEAVIASDARSWRTRVSGEMTPGGLALSKMWVIETGPASAVGIAGEYVDWEHSEVFGSPVVRTLIKTYPDGSPYRRTEVREIRSITDDEIRRVVSRPESGTKDVVVGDVVVAEIRDYSTGTASAERRQSAETSSSAQPGGQGPARVFLWIGIALIMGSIIFIRLNKM